MKALIVGFQTAGPSSGAVTQVWDGSGNFVGDFNLPVNFSYSDSTATDYWNEISSGVVSQLALNGVTIVSSDIIYLTPLLGAVTNPAIIQSATHSIVTSTGATGFQVSATRNVFVDYSVTIATTASIGGNASGTVVLEVAPTNSATAGDWVEVARFTNGQAITLAIALQSVQTLAGQLNGMVPAGYYAKLRSINNSGTPTYTYNSGREVIQ